VKSNLLNYKVKLRIEINKWIVLSKNSKNKVIITSDDLVKFIKKYAECWTEIKFKEGLIFLQKEHAFWVYKFLFKNNDNNEIWSSEYNNVKRAEFLNYWVLIDNKIIYQSIVEINNLVYLEMCKIHKISIDKNADLLDYNYLDNWENSSEQVTLYDNTTNLIKQIDDLIIWYRTLCTELINDEGNNNFIIKDGCLINGFLDINTPSGFVRIKNYAYFIEIVTLFYIKEKKEFN